MKTVYVVLTIIVVTATITFAVSQYTHAPEQSVTPMQSPSPTPEQSITIDNPQTGSTVSHTLQVSGKAQGSWYFEASFPIHVEDASGNTLASAPAHAQSDWMTTDFVPFTATLQLPASYTGNATLVAEKDNPSGLPQNAASIKIPIVIQ